MALAWKMATGVGGKWEVEWDKNRGKSDLDGRE